MSGKPSKNKSRSSAEILAGNPRCIYCANIAEDVEHMPSKSMFRAKDRPRGLEFPSCKACNKGTSTADSAVAFLARLDRFGEETKEWQLREAIQYLTATEQGAPGFADEIVGDRNARDTILRTNAGVLVPVSQTSAGPIAKALLDVWAAKLAMALYHEHTGMPLPLNGGVQAIWFLNYGLIETTAESFLKILPGYATLKRGRRKNVSGQFDYRFNSDDKSIVAALTHFHTNLHFFTIAMADPAAFGFPKDRLPNSRFSKPGELKAMMPPKGPPLLLTNPNWRPNGRGLLLPPRR